jgi:hypothetical protein
MDESDLENLGTLSRRYESRGDAGIVSDGEGDPGGVSYGLYQLATNRGVPQRFVEFLDGRYPAFHAVLAGSVPGTAEFTEAWKALAADDPEAFGAAQHAFIRKEYYDKVRIALEQEFEDLDLLGRSKALNDVLWSTAVQHGVKGGTTIFRQALADTGVLEVEDEELILRVYAERGRRTAAGALVHFASSSAQLQREVAERFDGELADALGAVRAEEQVA